jgi:hypothetical protein
MKYLETYNIYETLKSKEYGRKINPDDLQYYLDRFCKDFSWDDKPIYRGVYNSEQVKLSSAMLFNPKSIDRESANTKNYYTLLFDNSPYRNGFPKRSKSLICSTDYSTALNYGDKHYRVIPFDNAKIAVCGASDFWNSFPKLSEINIDSLDDFNTTINFLHDLLTGKVLQEKYHILVRQLEKFIPLYNDLTEEKFRELRKEENEGGIFRQWKWDHIKKLPKTLDGYFKLLDPVENGISLYDYNEYKKLSKYSDNEVWTDSKAIFVDSALEKIYKNK